MADDSTINGLRLATHATEDVQRGLRQRQADLYDLDARLRNLGPKSDPRAVIDQAEEVRRAMQIHREDQISEITRGLRAAQDATVQAGIDGDLSPERARTLTRVIVVASAETRRMELDLNDATRALEPVAQASVNDPDLATRSARSIEEATGLVESAQRSAFRLTQDLPDITRELEQTAALREQQQQLLDVPDLTAQRGERSPAQREHRPAPMLNRPINTASPRI